MSKPIIQVSNLSKCYTINHKDRASYNTLKDDFSKLIKSPFAKRDSTEEEFWALKNVSFEVNQGEIFGVIGKNGSGKSTLLKILSRIVDPTEGEIKLHGRVASLLEVGTGFHPDLTGRENIFFNGSMLGMSKKEINKKFHDIVEFAEIEKFIDTPVKFYSSGMYVRLAFAVAAHLDPDILILDEVLSVGDAAFQKKSLAKIKSTMESGTTVLYVSHSMDSVRELCSRGILLSEGRVEFIGNTEELTLRYTDVVNKTNIDDTAQKIWHGDKKTKKNDFFVPKSLSITDSDGKNQEKTLKSSKQYFVNIGINLLKKDERLNFGYVLQSMSTKATLYISLTTDTEKNRWPELKMGSCVIKSPLPMDILNGGEYKLSMIASVHNESWIIDPEEQSPSIYFSIDETLNKSPYWTGTRTGYIAPVLEWSIKDKKD